MLGGHSAAFLKHSDFKKNPSFSYHSEDGGGGGVFL
jgi:hypothetical protein